MLVPPRPLAEAEEIAGRAADAMIPGDPFAEESTLGPVVSQAQWDRVQGYIQKGLDEGATLVTGGLGKPDGLAQGFFTQPTEFSGVRRDLTIAQEEIFGPVLSILPLRHRVGGDRDRQRLGLRARRRRLGGQPGES
jgi:aldehyde dehydrogenase (NAD+)